MYIKRDISQELTTSPAWIQILTGPRQCGKSTLFASLYLDKPHQEINFDDLHLRQLANQDPALFISQFDPPLLLDEVQYVPNLFPELKKKIDQIKRAAVFEEKIKKKIATLFCLTGSNQILMDENIKESLAGRASYYYLNTLTVHEILQALPEIKIKDILFQGGWPELYSTPSLITINYLNDYIRSFVEKDIVMQAGIQKLTEFHTVIRLLSARTGNLIDYADVAKDSGVRSITIKEWVSFLERADLIYLLKPYFTNLNKRLIKTPKFYFLDTGLAARLQGWPDANTLFMSPQIGALFETLVLAEIVKFIRNYNKDWQLFFWRTKEGEEIDFLLQTNQNLYAFEAKCALQNKFDHAAYPTTFNKLFSPKHPLVIVTLGGKQLQLSKDCLALPITELHDFLKKLS